MKPLFVFVLLLITGGQAVAQTPLEHAPKAYQDSLNNYYQQASLPVYLFVSTTPNLKEAKKLESENLEAQEPMHLDGHGKHYIRHKDLIENHDIIFEINADGIAPKSGILPKEKAYQKNHKNFFASGAAFDFQASDEMSGIEQVLYAVNEKSYTSFTESLIFSEEGAYHISYYSVDNVGNAEKPDSYHFEIDATAPTTNLEVKGDHFEQYVSLRSHIVLQAEDALSGVDKIYYQLDEQTERSYNRPITLSGLEAGEHILRYYALDQVANKEVVKEFRFTLDDKAPVVQKEILGNRYEVNGKTYFAKETKLALNAIDQQSGIQKIYYALNGNDFQEYTEPVALNLQENKQVQIFAYATDMVNNKSRQTDGELEAYEQAIVVGTMDFDGPKLSYGFEGPVFQTRDSIFVSHQTKIALSGEDEQSGLGLLTYQIDTTETQDYSSPISLKENGIYQITLKGYDNLLNDSELSFTVINDTKGPNIFPRMSVEPIKKSQKNEGIFPAHVILFLAATDDKAGLEQIYYSINGQKETEYRGMIRDFEMGETYEIEVRAVDKLGNDQKSMIRFSIEAPNGVLTKSK